MTRGPFIQTYTGKLFYPLDPRPEDICIEDIAHHLSLINRYNGACAFPYCPTEDQKVLCADLSWKYAGDLRVGDNLIGFDEFAVVGNKRRYRPSKVTYSKPILTRVVGFELSDGSYIKCAINHPWLTSTNVSSKNQQWRLSSDIIKSLDSGKKRFMQRYFNVWEEDNSRLGGWLAGIVDGEGHLSFQNRRGVQLGVAQNPGLILDQIVSLFEQFGFDITINPKSKYSNARSVYLAGGWREIAHYLGQYRPVRLIDKFVKQFDIGDFDKQLQSANEPLEFIRWYDEGDNWVVGLETSTRTYFCEGFPAHNSVAQHCCYVSDYCSDKNKLWGLLHDAEEAYGPDIPSPIKHNINFGDWPIISKSIMGAICAKFNIHLIEPDEVKLFDKLLLGNEHRRLMTYHFDLPYIDGLVIEQWSWQKARTEFMIRFRGLYE